MSIALIITNSQKLLHRVKNKLNVALTAVLILNLLVGLLMSNSQTLILIVLVFSKLTLSIT